ncbi:MAG TPA: hypothetical protein P5136_01610 [Methanofastidiosum sp.]|nr:hypothetical protein [Methanofastidiosum sp.]
MFIELCANCGQDIKATDDKGKRVCPICGSYDFKTIEKDMKGCVCCYCKTPLEKTNWKDNPPFYNAKTHTFYCGCRGWD